MSNYWERMLEGKRLSRRRVLGATSGGLIGAALLAACGDDSSSDNSGSSPSPTSGANGSTTPSSTATTGQFTPSDGEPQRGGRFLDRESTQDGWNPVSVETAGRWTDGRYVWDRLITSREGGEYILESAESVETPDDLTVVFTLKPENYFHDIAPVNGRAVVASDIKASQEYVIALPNAFDKVFATDFLESVEAPDDRTVIYHLKKPNAYLFSGQMLGSGTGQPIIPPEIMENLNTGPAIGSGPYFLDPSSELGVRHLYKRHPRYHEAHNNQPYPDESELKFIADEAAAEAAFRSGQLDYMRAVNPTLADSIPADLGDQVRLLSFESFGNFSWNMNMRKEGLPFDDIRVREAFWRLTNQQQVLDLAYVGKGTIPPGLLPSSLTLWNLDRSEVEQYYEEDVEKATQLLSAANFDLDREWDCMGSYAGSPTDQSAQIWQQQLSRAGVKVTISNVLGQAQLFQRWSDNDWEVMVQGSPGYDTPGQSLRNLHSDGWSDVFTRFGLQDPELDALIEESEITTDLQENIALVKEVQLKAIQSFSSFYQLITPQLNHLLRSRVQNWELTQNTPVYQLGMWLKQS